MIRSLSALFITLLFVLHAQTAWTDEFSPVWFVEVTRVSDGDSFVVTGPAQRKVRIRLYGIDCAEMNQPGGKEARDYITALLLNQTVVIEPVENDRYGRTVAFAYRQGRTVEEMLLEQGLAWVYEKYCKLPVCDRYREIMRTSVENELGIWSGPDPVEPWEWRRLERLKRQTQ